MNSSVVRMGVFEGEYHWHKHDNDDEFFFCLQGELCVDLEEFESATTVPVFWRT